MRFASLTLLLALAGCGNALPISRYDAEAVAKAGGSVTVSAGDMSRYDIEAIAKAAAQGNARVIVVDSGNFSRYDMEAIAAAAPGIVTFED